LEQSLQGVQEVVDSTFENGEEGTSPSADDPHSQVPVGATRQILHRLRTTVDGLRAHVDAQRTANREQVESLQAQLETAAAQKAELEKQKAGLEESLRVDLEAAQSDKAELTARLEGERTAARDLRSELQAARAEIDAERASKENQMLRFNEELQRARVSHDILDRGVNLIAQALAEDDQRDPAHLAQRAREVRADLAERDFWVTLLLKEIARWRLKPFPRKLSTQESKFLKEQGQDGSA
jgi:chromosome segregation ATPase